MSDSVAVSAPLKSETRTPWYKRLMKDPVGVVSLIILVIVFIASMLAPLLTSQDPNLSDIANVWGNASPEHILGTDSAGRDVYARMLYGGRMTFAPAAIASLVAVGVGLPSGLIAGYYGGIFDSVSVWISNMLLSVPAVVILLAARAALGPSMWISMGILGVIISPTFFRLVRTSVQAVRNELYVDAARVSGLSDSRIIGRHILTAVRAPVIIQIAIVAGISIAIQAGLEFLGLGDINRPTWGMMLNEGFLNVYLSPKFMLWPALMISLVTAAFALLGNSLRDALEDDEKPPRISDKKKKAIAEKARAEANTTVVGDDSREHLLSVRDLQVGYPTSSGDIKLVVDGVSFDVDRGEVLGIVGESGSGKTQTAFSVLGLLPESAEIVGGQVTFDGIELISPDTGAISRSKMDPLRGKRIAYIPQEPTSNLDPAFTIGAQLTRPLVKQMGMTKKQARERAIELLTIVGLPDPERTMKSYPHEISGGQAQRVLIAGAVASEPDLLIADEPTTALDVTVQAEVLDLLRDLQERLDMGVIMVTHNFGVVADLCDRVVVMQNARLVEQGSVREILQDPKEPYTRTLLDSMLENKIPRTYLLTQAEASAL